MKNNRLTNAEVLKLKMATDRIKELSSLERAKFLANSEEDKKIKEIIRPYMMWFDVVANGIEDIIDGKETNYNSFE